ncbi:unnamed protein product, partial [Choristocarpus tenellus]
EELPAVLLRTAGSFGLDLSAPRVGGIANCTTDGEERGGEARGWEKEGEGHKAFKKLAGQLVSTLRNECRDLRRLGRELSKLWPIYREMLESGIDERELRAGIKPYLDETTKCFHQVRKSNHSRVQEGALALPSVEFWAGSADRPGLSIDLDLPRNTLYLLVSAFLASHNPRETDCDAFTSRTTRVPKKHRVGSMVGNAGSRIEAGVEDLPEPKVFPLERLLSILTSLVSSNSTNTRAANATGNAELFSQVCGGYVS